MFCLLFHERNWALLTIRKLYTIKRTLATNAIHKLSLVYVLRQFMGNFVITMRTNSSVSALFPPSSVSKLSDIDC